MQLQGYKSIKRGNTLKKGYTLIELLVGITIISIVFTIGYAGFREFSRRQALSGVSKTVKADLRLAQQLASTGQKPSVDQGSCSQLSGYTFEREDVSEYSISANCFNAGFAVSRLVKTVNLDTDVTISVSPNPSIQFKVLGQGTNSDSDFTITLDHTSGSQTTIVVGSGGEIN